MCTVEEAARGAGSWLRNKRVGEQNKETQILQQYTRSVKSFPHRSVEVRLDQNGGRGKQLLQMVEGLLSRVRPIKRHFKRCELSEGCDRFAKVPDELPVEICESQESLEFLRTLRLGPLHLGPDLGQVNPQLPIFNPRKDTVCT